MNNADRFQKARMSITTALRAIDEELSRPNGPAVAPEEQLRHFKRVLTQMDADVQESSPHIVNYGIGHAVVDGWPFDSKLGELLITAEQDYLSLAK